MTGLSSLLSDLCGAVAIPPLLRKDGTPIREHCYSGTCQPARVWESLALPVPSPLIALPISGNAA